MRPLLGLCLVLLGWTAGVTQPLPQMTPEQAMRQAAEKLPSVQVARALLESAQAYASSIGAQPNPFVRLSYIAGTPIEEANALAFRFEIAGQPNLREQSARRAAEARSQDLTTEKRSVALRTGVAYYTYWEKLGILEVARERVDLARELERSSFRRYSVGEISQNAHLRVQLELARAQADEVTARIDSEQTLGLLNLLLGRGVNEPIELPSGLALAPPNTTLAFAQNATASGSPGIPPSATLSTPGTSSPPPVGAPNLSSASSATAALMPQLDALQAGLAVHPELEALRKEAAAQERQTELARRGNAPELLLQFYRDRFGPTNVNAVQLSLTIPIWDWGTVAAEVGRQEGLQKAAEARVAERALLLQQRALEAYKRYQSALEKEALLAEQAARFHKLSNGARRAYDANLMTFLEVFDVQQSYRQAIQSYVTAQADVYRAALEIGALSPTGFFEEVSRVQP